MKRSYDFIGFNSTTTDKVRGAIACLVALTALNLYLQAVPGVFASTRAGAAVATGIIRVSGTVTVDGAEATSWQTIFPGSHVATLEGSESIVDLGFTRFRLSAETELTLDFSRTNIAGAVGNGVVRAFVPAGIPVNLETADAELKTDFSQPASFIVQVDGGTTRVSVEKGRIDVRAGGRLTSVGVGQVLTTAPGSPALLVSQSNLTSGQKVGIFVAIGIAAAILAIAIMGRDKSEPQFGGCVIVPSGESSSICP